MLHPVGFDLTKTTDTSRMPSPALWDDCPMLDYLALHKGAYYFYDDFGEIGFTVPTTEGQIGPWYKAFSSTGGTIKPTSATTQVRGGVITLGSNDDDEGASIATCSQPFQITRGDGRLWFEARVKVTSTAVTLADCFIGLGELMTLTATVPITATAGAMADQNMVGFLRPGTSTTGDGSSLRIFYKANGVTAVTIETVAGAFVSDTFIKLGFKFTPTDNLLKFYIDNVVRSTTYTIPSAAGTDFPNDVLLGPIAATLNTAGSSTHLFTVDWWRVFQEDSSGV